MSWSFYAVGRPAAVLAKARDEVSRQKCAEPEEAIKNHVLSILENSLQAMPEASAVSIKASGSQGGPQNVYQWGPTKYTNDLKLDISPLFGFVD